MSVKQYLAAAASLMMTATAGCTNDTSLPPLVRGQILSHTIPARDKDLGLFPDMIRCQQALREELHHFRPSADTDFTQIAEGVCIDMMRSRSQTCWWKNASVLYCTPEAPMLRVPVENELNATLG